MEEKKHFSLCKNKTQNLICLKKIKNPNGVREIHNISFFPAIWHLSKEKLESWPFRSLSCQSFNLAINSDIKLAEWGRQTTPGLCHPVGREQVVTIPAGIVFARENPCLGEVYCSERSFIARGT